MDSAIIINLDPERVFTPLLDKMENRTQLMSVISQILHRIPRQAEKIKGVI